MSEFKNIEDLVEAQTASVRGHIVSIFSSNGGKLEQIATGFIVFHRDKYFILTAAHVIDEIENDNGSPRFGLGDRITSLKLKRKVKSDNGTLSPLRELDFGFWELDVDLLDSEETNRIAITSDKLLSTGIVDSENHVLIAGYPNSWNTEAQWSHYLPEPSVDGLLCSYAYIPNLDFDLNVLGKKATTHVAINWGEKDKNGKSLAYPKGVSGAPVWVFPQEENIDEAKVVGLFIEYDEEMNVGLFTRSEVLLEILDYIIDK